MQYLRKSFATSNRHLCLHMFAAMCLYVCASISPYKLLWEGEKVRLSRGQIVQESENDGRGPRSLVLCTMEFGLRFNFPVVMTIQKAHFINLQPNKCNSPSVTYRAATNRKPLANAMKLDCLMNLPFGFLSIHDMTKPCVLHSLELWPQIMHLWHCTDIWTHTPSLAISICQMIDLYLRIVSKHFTQTFSHLSTTLNVS